MNVKLLLGIAFFVIGLATAVVGIVGVVGPETQTRNVAIPLIAALSLAVGGLLIGISLGNWKNPRSALKEGDEVVNPEGYHKMKHV